jgi:OHCU decarboxylase
MANERPFDSVAELIACAENIWLSLAPHDWLEAFRSHPKIGEKKAAEQTSAAAQKWSEQEQSGASNAGQETMQAFAELNREYEKKFGYIFIVCATGKSLEEMLSILRERLGNNPDEELRIAATEQAKITELRINKLLNQ